MLKGFLSPRGRRPRLTYWRGAALVPLFAILAMLLAVIGLSLITGPPFVGGNVGRTFVEVPLTLAILAVALWAGLAIAVQRLHDRDRSGWWVLIALVPLAGSLWYLFWNGLRPGTPGPNRFGPDPLTPNAAVVAVFGDGPATPRTRRPVASTIVAWVILLAFLVLNTLLFQSPGRRASRPMAPPPASPGR